MILQKDMDKIWLVIPAYNEEKYIEKVIKKLLKYSSKIILVNDGSRDGTKGIVEKFPIVHLSHKVNLGKGAAMKTGCDFAFDRLEAEAVILMDSDDQHDPTEIQKFIKSLNKGYQVVLGARELREDMPRMRQMGNQISSWLVYLVTGRYFQDIPCGYRALTKDAYKILRWDSTGYEVETEMMVKLGSSQLSFTEIPVKTIYHENYKGFTLMDGITILLKLPLWILRIKV